MGGAGGKCSAFPLQAQNDSVISFHSSIWKTADSGNLKLPWARSAEEEGAQQGWGWELRPREPWSLPRGPSFPGGGLRLGLEGRPPGSQSRPPSPARFL